MYESANESRLIKTSILAKRNDNYLSQREKAVKGSYVCRYKCSNNYE